jgi:hypothetical protein
MKRDVTQVQIEGRLRADAPAWREAADQADARLRRDGPGGPEVPGVLARIGPAGWWIAAAAVVLLVTAAGWWSLRAPAGPEPQVVQGPPTDVEPQPTAEDPAAPAELARPTPAIADAGRWLAQTPARLPAATINRVQRARDLAPAPPAWPQPGFTTTATATLLNPYQHEADLLQREITAAAAAVQQLVPRLSTQAG